MLSMKSGRCVSQAASSLHTGVSEGLTCRPSGPLARHSMSSAAAVGPASFMSGTRRFRSSSISHSLHQLQSSQSELQFANTLTTLQQERPQGNLAASEHVKCPAVSSAAPEGGAVKHLHSVHCCLVTQHRCRSAGRVDVWEHHECGGLHSRRAAPLNNACCMKQLDYAAY
jgi:hypothetical protein